MAPLMPKNTEDWPEESPPTLWGEEKVNLDNYLPPQLTQKKPGLATTWGSAPPQLPFLPAQLILDTTPDKFRLRDLKDDNHSHTQLISSTYNIVFYLDKIEPPIITMVSVLR